MRIFRRRKPHHGSVQCVDCGTWLANTLKTFPEFDHRPLCFPCILIRRSPSRTPPWIKHDNTGSSITMPEPVTPDEMAQAVRQIVPPDADVRALQVTQSGPLMIEVTALQTDGTALTGVVQRRDLR